MSGLHSVIAGWQFDWQGRLHGVIAGWQFDYQGRMSGYLKRQVE